MLKSNHKIQSNQISLPCYLPIVTYRQNMFNKGKFAFIKLVKQTLTTGPPKSSPELLVYNIFFLFVFFFFRLPICPTLFQQIWVSILSRAICYLIPCSEVQAHIFSLNARAMNRLISSAEYVNKSTIICGFFLLSLKTLFAGFKCQDFFKVSISLKTGWMLQTCWLGKGWRAQGTLECTLFMLGKTNSVRK